MSQTRKSKLSLFDWLGALAVATFVAVLAIDFAELGWRGEEVRLEVSPAELAAGFREGVEWHAIYDDDQKIGYARLERRRLDDGYEFSNYTLLHSRVLGRQSTSEVSVRTELGPAFGLRGFEASVSGDIAQLEATGRVEPGLIIVDVEGILGGAPKHLELPAQKPVFDFSLQPLVMRSDLEAGQRFSFEHFDPTTLSTQETTLEYLGRDTVYVMGEPVEAHHLRQQIAGQQLESWVNDLGEVLREDLPGGLTAVREAEAEATWGIDREGTREP